jgi:hypothetical protein
MDMRMVGEGLPPYMKDGNEAKLAAIKKAFDLRENQLKEVK